MRSLIRDKINQSLSKNRHKRRIVRRKSIMELMKEKERAYERSLYRKTKKGSTEYVKYDVKSELGNLILVPLENINTLELEVAAPINSETFQVDTFDSDEYKKTRGLKLAESEIQGGLTEFAQMLEKL